MPPVGQATTPFEFQFIPCRLQQTQEAQQQLASNTLQQAEPALARLAGEPSLRDKSTSQPDLPIVDEQIPQAS